MCIDEIIVVFIDSLKHSKNMGLFFIERSGDRAIVRIDEGNNTPHNTFVLDNIEDNYIELLIQRIQDEIINKRDHVVLYGHDELKGAFLDFFVFGDKANKKIEIVSDKDYNLLKQVYEDYQKENNGEIARRR